MGARELSARRRERLATLCAARDDKTPRRPRRSLWWGLGAATLGVFAGIEVARDPPGLLDAPAVADDPSAVHVLPGVAVPLEVAESPADRVVLEAAGYVVARHRAILSAPVAGELVAVPVEVGDTVDDGALLARVDDTAVRAQWRLARAEERAAASALLEPQVRWAEARREHARRRRLSEAGVGSAAAQESARAQVDAWAAHLEHLRDRVAVARRRADSWRHEVERRVVRAPFRGVVASVDAQVGEAVAPIPDPVRFARVGLLTLVDMDSLEVEVDINETRAAMVSVGQAAEIRLDAFPASVFEARVVGVTPVAHRQRATRRVRLVFDRLDPRVRPEMGVRVAFQRADRRDKKGRDNSEAPGSAGGGGRCGQELPTRHHEG